MKIFAHRGWSAGVEENTLEAFKKAHDAGLAGVEFDVRLADDGRMAIVSHDAVVGTSALTLRDALAFLATTELELLIEFKEYTREFFETVQSLLIEYKLEKRTTLFAFPEIAKDFPWSESRTVSLGVIARYPHHITPSLQTYKPDMILLGWGSVGQRRIFKLAWSILSLPKYALRYPGVKFVVGVAYDGDDISWLAKQNGLYGATMDCA